MPLTWTTPGDELTWPLPPVPLPIPRTAGTFSRALRLLTRERVTHTCPRRLAKCSLDPARLLQDHVPAMRRKGRLQPRRRCRRYSVRSDASSPTRRRTSKARGPRQESGTCWSMASSWFATATSSRRAAGTRNPKDNSLTCNTWAQADIGADCRSRGCYSNSSCISIISGESPSLQCSIYRFPCSSYLCSNIRHGSVPRSRGEVSRVAARARRRRMVPHPGPGPPGRTAASRSRQDASRSPGALRSRLMLEVT